ncbi:MAG: 50S ribosomal protein L13, partial [Chloroflexi bacterium]
MSSIFTTQTPWVKKEEVKREWYIVDAKDKILGRLASK